MEKLPLVFYHKLCELYFAIASKSRPMDEEEYITFKNLILNQYKNPDSTPAVSRNDALEKFEVVFEWFDYENLDPSECFDNFIEYRKDHKEFYDQVKEKLIWKTANIIEEHFASANSTDKKFLKKLRPILTSSSI